MHTIAVLNLSCSNRRKKKPSPWRKSVSSSSHLAATTLQNSGTWNSTWEGLAVARGKSRGHQTRPKQRGLLHSCGKKAVFILGSSNWVNWRYMLHEISLNSCHRNRLSVTYSDALWSRFIRETGLLKIFLKFHHSLLIYLLLLTKHEKKNPTSNATTLITLYLETHKSTFNAQTL